MTIKKSCFRNHLTLFNKKINKTDNYLYNAKEMRPVGPKQFNQKPRLVKTRKSHYFVEN